MEKHDNGTEPGAGLDIRLESVRPLNGRIVTTLDRWPSDRADERGVITAYAGTPKDFQTVLFAAEGSPVKAGDVVIVTLARYAEKKHDTDSLHDGVVSDNPTKDYNIDTIWVGGGERMLIDVFDVVCVADEYEYVEPDASEEARGAGYVI